MAALHDEPASRETLVKLVREYPFRREFRPKTRPKEPKTCTMAPENS